MNELFEANDAVKETVPADPFAPAAPSLTLDPFGGETELTAPVEQAPASKEESVEAQAEAMLSEEEKKQVEDFSSRIELSNSALIMQYGAGAQKKIADFSEAALNNVRTKDLGQVGELLGNVVTELKEFDVEEDQKGFFSFFKRGANKITAMRAKYDKAEANIDKITGMLEQHQITLMKDVAMLDKMYETNKVYFRELTMYILAGKKKLKKEELPALAKKAQETGLPEDAQAANDLSALCNRFEKKIHDLELTRMISIQMAPQIRLVQNNDTLMSEKIQSTIVNTIPLWKSQMVLALGVTHSQQAVEAQRSVTDMTNQLLRKNAETLKMATVETAKESERGIVDLETLKHTNESLISTFDEVLKIQTEGREKRRNAEAEMQRMEDELKKKLLEIRN